MDQPARGPSCAVVRSASLLFGKLHGGPEALFRVRGLALFLGKNSLGQVRKEPAATNQRELLHAGLDPGEFRLAFRRLSFRRECDGKKEWRARAGAAASPTPARAPAKESNRGT